MINSYLQIRVKIYTFFNININQSIVKAIRQNLA